MDFYLSRKKQIMCKYVFLERIYPNNRRASDKIKDLKKLRKIQA